MLFQTQIFILIKRLNNRSRICHTSSLNNDSIEFDISGEKFTNTFDKVITDCAAETAVVHRNNLFGFEFAGFLGDEVGIDTDLWEGILLYERGNVFVDVVQK